MVLGSRIVRTPPPLLCFLRDLAPWRQGQAKASQRTCGLCSEGISFGRSCGSHALACLPCIIFGIYVIQCTKIHETVLLCFFLPALPSLTFATCLVSLGFPSDFPEWYQLRPTSSAHPPRARCLVEPSQAAMLLDQQKSRVTPMPRKGALVLPCLCEVACQTRWESWIPSLEETTGLH